MSFPTAPLRANPPTLDRYVSDEVSVLVVTATASACPEYRPPGRRTPRRQTTSTEHRPLP